MKKLNEVDGTLLVLATTLMQRVGRCVDVDIDIDVHTDVDVDVDVVNQRSQTTRPTQPRGLLRWLRRTGPSVALAIQPLYNHHNQLSSSLR